MTIGRVAGAAEQAVWMLVPSYVVTWLDLVSG
jgi:hypothetical protein